MNPKIKELHFSLLAVSIRAALYGGVWAFLLPHYRKLRQDKANEKA